MKKKSIPKKKLVHRIEDELSKPPRFKRKEGKKTPHHFKPWQVNLEEEE